MKHPIEIIIAPDGALIIDAVGFKRLTGQLPLELEVAFWSQDEKS